MAAHVLRILSEIEQNKVAPAQVKHALGYAPGLDLLEFAHWERLNSACDQAPADLPAIARELIPHYVAEYFRLDCPPNYEAWIRVKFPDTTPTRTG